MNAGIYRIRVGRWSYYGKTDNFETCSSQHYRELKKGIHDNIILQLAYDKYNTFHFEVCCIEEEEELKSKLLSSLLDEAKRDLFCTNAIYEGTQASNIVGQLQ